ncbi:hypothetical protein MIND_00815100 [Mycena indigotica]|uniref:Uncharacterized protein n=1 Tax=Mycena indigotica TaxID=2126181 RepID=A0A8H6VYD2_9AGAR|nr:uncharacterized protein MIND_00815100 [Mycena indigotica]KAF7298679.1 hypothetical protein MIND_00815100 [Mycena indigotica]
MDLTSPVFPPELEREIFEKAAEAYRPDIIRLMLVSKRVYLWIRPMLFRIVGASDTGIWPPLRLALDSEPAFLRHSVRFLCLTLTHYSAVTKEDTDRLLTICTGLVDLAISHKFPMTNHLSLLAKMHNLRRLTCSLEKLCGNFESIDGRHEAFSRITHLELLDDGLGWLKSVLRPLTLMPATTHLSLSGGDNLDDSGFWDDIQQLLDAMPRLVLLALVWGRLDVLDWFESVNATPVRDQRFVAGCYNYPTDGEDNVWVEWDESASGTALDYWGRGEIFLQRKRRGEVSETRFWMDDWMYEARRTSPQDLEGEFDDSDTSY